MQSFMDYNHKVRHKILCSSETCDNIEQQYYISLPLIPLLQPDNCLNKLYKSKGKNK